MDLAQLHVRLSFAVTLLSSCSISFYNSFSIWVSIFWVSYISDRKTKKSVFKYFYLTQKASRARLRMQERVSITLTPYSGPRTISLALTIWLEFFYWQILWPGVALWIRTSPSANLVIQYQYPSSRSRSDNLKHKYWHMLNFVRSYV